MDRNTQIERFARRLGSDFFGVADLTSARDAIIEQGGALVAQYPRAVSIGLFRYHLGQKTVPVLPNESE